MIRGDIYDTESGTMSVDVRIWGTPGQYAHGKVQQALEMAAWLARCYGFEVPHDFSVWAQCFFELRADLSTSQKELADESGHVALATMAAIEATGSESSMEAAVWTHALHYAVAAGLLTDTAPGRSVALSKLAMDSLYMIHFLVRPPALDVEPTWTLYGDPEVYPPSWRELWNDRLAVMAALFPIGSEKDGSAAPPNKRV